MKPVRGIMPASMLGSLALVSGVALTATSGWLIVSAAYRPQILTLLSAIVLVRAFGMARPALRYAERLRSHDAALAHLAGERAEVYAGLVPLTPARLGRRRRSDLLAGVVDDLDDLAFAQVRVIVPLISAVVTALVAALVDAVVLASAAPVILSLLVCCAAVGAIDWWIERRTQGAVVESRARLTSVASLVSTQASELAAVGGTDTALGWVADAQRQLSRALVRQSWGRAVGVALTPIVTIAHVAMMVAVVQPWVERGMATPLAALLVLTPVALGEVVGVVPDAVGALARAQAARSRLAGLLDQEPAVREPGARSLGTPTTQASIPAMGSDEAAGHSTDEGSTDPAGVDLDLRGVSASWGEGRRALAPTDLHVRAGSRLAVVGANGCGKSTLLAVLARHLDPASGSYRVDGVDVTTVPGDAVRAHIAVVDDEPHVFASTLRENLRFARPGCDDAEIERALERAGLREWRAALPQGLDTPLGTGGQGVSGGERARLAIARALLSQRPVLLLDEPVAHLDHPTATAVLRDLLHAAHAHTVVLVSHRPEGLTGVDAVLNLDRTPTSDAARIEA